MENFDFDDDTWRNAIRAPGPRSMRLSTKPGEMVRFLGRNGYEMERTRAMKVLEVGILYEVQEMEVGSSSSRVRIPEGWFNTVMFANEDEPEVD